MTGEHTGSILFHCWRHDPPERARATLASIVEKGFLLTTTNHGGLDTFTVRDGENQLRKIEVMQRARICFTDIPLGLLATHGAAYGRYGVGFSRETIVQWGGCPVWYLPNHHGGDTLKDLGPMVVNGLHAAMIAVDSYCALVKATEESLRKGQLKKHFVTQTFTHGNPLVGEALIQWLTYGRNCIEGSLSFIKEMSPQDSEDFRYLYEREWRIVELLQIRGKNPCRVLTDMEKRELCLLNPNWKKHPVVNDINIQVRYPSAPMIDSFRFFDGLPGAEKVSRKIDAIVVPNDAEKTFAEKMISENPRSFKAGGPGVRIFPS
jgi:hypothetical protein